MAREYKISVNEDWINPEDTLLDSSSDYSDLEIPVSNTVFKAVLSTAIFLSAVVVVSVFDLSVRQHDKLANLALQNKSVNFSVPPPRGIIFDRLGKPLVRNEAIFDLLVVSKEAKGDSFNRIQDHLLESEPRSQKPERSRTDNNLKSEQISKLANVLHRDPVEFGEFISANVKSNSVFFASSDLDKDRVLKIKYINPKGFYIVPNVKRRYMDGVQFSSVLGYIGKVNKNELSSDSYYHSTDIVGRLGLEAQYEKYLRGEHGKIFFQDDLFNRTQSQFLESEPWSRRPERSRTDDNLNKDPAIGNSVVLNIDYEIQKRLFNELFNVLKDTSYSRAAAVVQNPQTGAIMAMVSFPVYDNNLFVSGLSEDQFKNLFENKSRPLFNRVISGLYNPGSTIKPLIGLMTLEENIFSPSDVIQNCIGLTIVNPYNPDDTYTFNNWRKEYGPFNLKRAIANSCNVYFYIAGGGSPASSQGFGNVQGLGIERIASYLKLSLADSKLGIDLPGEEKGFVPTPDWKLASRGEGWYQGDTYNISIGQGDLLVTPLWLNSYISAIANGGTLYKPLVAKQILDNNKEVIKSFEPETLGHLMFKDEVIREVKNAMAETVASGTARLLQNLPVKVGAKTGTAEVVKGRTLNSMMTVFAPFENPEVNITVLIEGAVANEGLAIKTVHEFMQWYFSEY